MARLDRFADGSGPWPGPLLLPYGVDFGQVDLLLYIWAGILLGVTLAQNAVDGNPGAPAGRSPPSSASGTPSSPSSGTGTPATARTRLSRSATGRRPSLRVRHARGSVPRENHHRAARPRAAGSRRGACGGRNRLGAVRVGAGVPADRVGIRLAASLYAPRPGLPGPAKSPEAVNRRPAVCVTYRERALSCLRGASRLAGHGARRSCANPGAAP